MTYEEVAGFQYKAKSQGPKTNGRFSTPNSAPA
jgi:hypothetical protein